MREVAWKLSWEKLLGVLFVDVGLPMSAVRTWIQHSAL